MIERVWQNSSGIGIMIALAGIAGALIVLPLPTVAIGIGGALALLTMLRWHELALYALIFAVPFGSWFPISISIANLTAVDLLVAAVIALWLVRMIVENRGITIHFPPLTISFAIFLAAALVSITAALSLQFAGKELVKWLEMFAVFIYVANDLDKAKVSRALIAMFVAGAIEALIGVYQFVFRAGPEGFALFGRFIRAYGTFEQPNPYAGYLGLIIPIAFGVVLGFLASKNSKSQIPNPKFIRNPQFAIRNPQSAIEHLILAIVATISLFAMFAALLMSWSRGAWMGVAAGVGVTFIVQSRRAFVLSLITTLVLTLVLLLNSLNIIPPAISARFSGISDYFGVFDVRGVHVDDANFAIVERMAHWQAAWDMFSDYPMLGVGFGNYQVVYPAYALPHWSDPLGHAHNYYLNVLAETGLIGLAAYLIFWTAAFGQGWRAVRLTNGIERGIAAGLLGVLVALSVHNAFDDLFVHGMQVQVGIALGIISTMTNGTTLAPPARAGVTNDR